MAAILGPLISDKKLNFEQYLLNTHWYYTLQIHGITMPLQEWNSNCKEFSTYMDDKERKESPSILGVQWNTQEDALLIKLIQVEEIKGFTKQRALSILSRVFDLIGLLNPITVRGKLYISKLWKLKVSWDEDLNEDLVSEFKSLVKDFSTLDIIRFPRNECLREDQGILHIFCDTSRRAYGMVMYICTGNHSRSLMSRSCIVPMKEKTIPQLELTAVLLGCRLTSYIQEVLSKSFPTYICTDSSTCIQWVGGNN